MSETMSKASIAQERHLAFAVSLMEHLAVPTFVLDAQHRVLVWNEACEQLTSIPACEVLGSSKHWQAFYEGEKSKKVPLGHQRIIIKSKLTDV